MEEGYRGKDTMAVRKKMKPETSMVNITEKQVVRRKAVAEGSIKLSRESINTIQSGRSEKGDVLAVAEVAGISAAKRTSELIPLCHQIPLNSVEISFRMGQRELRCRSTVEAEWRTGVEMEALTAVAASLLTVWDMVKRTEKDEDGQYPGTAIEWITVKSKRKAVQIGRP